jgi:hypothetical protein
MAVQIEPEYAPVSVAIDPDEKAEEGLKQLEELGKLQDQQKAVQTKVNDALRELRQLLGLLEDFVGTQNEQETLIGQYLFRLPEEMAESWWTNIYLDQNATKPNMPLLEEFLALADRIANQDNASRHAQQERQPHIDERKRLIEFQLKVQGAGNEAATIMGHN